MAVLSQKFLYLKVGPLESRQYSSCTHNRIVKNCHPRIISKHKQHPGQKITAESYNSPKLSILPSILQVFSNTPLPHYSWETPKPLVEVQLYTAYFGSTFFIFHNPPPSPLQWNGIALFLPLGKSTCCSHCFCLVLPSTESQGCKFLLWARTWYPCWKSRCQALDGSRGLLAIRCWRFNHRFGSKICWKLI